MTAPLSTTRRRMLQAAGAASAWLGLRPAGAQQTDPGVDLPLVSPTTSAVAVGNVIQVALVGALGNAQHYEIELRPIAPAQPGAVTRVESTVPGIEFKDVSYHAEYGVRARTANAAAQSPWSAEVTVATGLPAAVMMSALELPALAGVHLAWATTLGASVARQDQLVVRIVRRRGTVESSVGGGSAALAGFVIDASHVQGDSYFARLQSRVSVAAGGAPIASDWSASPVLVTQVQQPFSAMPHNSLAAVHRATFWGR